MSQFINNIETCDNCLQSKLKVKHNFKQLHPTEMPSRRWGTISMDFTMPLTSKGYTRILVVVDRLTKMALFIPIKKEISAMETVNTLMKTVFKIHGLPNKIISDRGGQFAAGVIQEMYSRIQICVALSTAYHPQMDGQTERVNQDLESYI
jgi:IS30 family transposase